MFVSASIISLKIIRLLLVVVASLFLLVALGFTDPVADQSPRHVRVKVTGHGQRTHGSPNGRAGDGTLPLGHDVLGARVGLGEQRHREDTKDSIFLAVPLGDTLEELQSEQQPPVEEQMPFHVGKTDAKSNDNQHMLLSHEDKVSIAQHLQDVTYEYQDEYRQYMDQHMYGYPPDNEDGNSMLLESFYREPVAEPHNGVCRSHEPGIVRATDSKRLYCFGASTLRGHRVCDTQLPNYTMLHDKQTGHDVYELYGKKFAYIPYYHRAQYTASEEQAVGKLKDAVTVTSQGSWNRLEHLRKLVKLWQGPVSFALLLDDKSQLPSLSDIISADGDMQKYLDLHVAWRLDHSIDDSDAFYPINMLRNMGLQTTRTGLVFILDVDNIPSGPMSAFRKWMVEAEAVASQTASAAVCPGLDAFIPPAVEMTADRLAKMYEESRAQGSLTDRLAKNVLVEGFYDGTVKPMHVYFGPAYVPTNHFAWSMTRTVDPVTYLTRFEPYYIARMPLPLFNETFVNRGGNYAQQVFEMHAAGYRFFRLPTGFIVDIPHEKQSNTGKSKRSSRAAPIQENRTKQAVHDETFIANVWLMFAEWVSHRYGFNMPSPAVSDIMFRKYRRAQEKVTIAMWHLLSLEEAPDLAEEEKEEQDF